MQALNDLIGRFDQKNDWVIFLRLAAGDCPDAKQYADGTKSLRASDGRAIDPRNWTLLSMTGKDFGTHEATGSTQAAHTRQADGAPTHQNSASASCMADFGPS
jgi:hypothetical protein